MSDKWKKIWVTIFLAALVYVIAFIAGAPLAKPVQGFIDDIFLHERNPAVLGETALVVLVSDTDNKRKRGLGGKEKIDELEGMLFVFEEDKRHGIWMKDVKFPLDIIWLNHLSEVIHIEERISPDTFPKTFHPNNPSRYVLEVNAGFVDKYNIKKGDLFTSL